MESTPQDSTPEAQTSTVKGESDRIGLATILGLVGAVASGVVAGVTTIVGDAPTATGSGKLGAALLALVMVGRYAQRVADSAGAARRALPEFERLLDGLRPAPARAYREGGTIGTTQIGPGVVTGAKFDGVPLDIANQTLLERFDGDVPSTYDPDADVPGPDDHAPGNDVVPGGPDAPPVEREGTDR